ncbi:MAG TPA: FAD-dependent oxidoreductase [Vicinamibacterales bacterium]|jgi:monoamine oxidase|nr:FAD-dependent oxidoreductase [Vicinamibacterales bacterium]
MARHTLFNQFTRTIRTAWFAEQDGLTTREALERVMEARGEAERRRSRREFLGDIARVAASGTLATVAGPVTQGHAKPRGGSRSIAIVGAGMAGLVCADHLREAGILATVYEAAPDRVGGRVRSIPDVFPGRTIELGGEFIDYWHATILKYVRRFDLTRVDLFDTAGEVLYRIDGVTYPESTIVDAFRDVVLRMKADMRSVTSGISARNFEPAPGSADRRLDNTNLQEYLEQLGAADVLLKAIQSVFGGEYGQEIHLQSCLNFVLFAKLTRSKSRIVYFGANNAERYAIAEGNEALARRLRDELVAAGGSVQGRRTLVALKKATDGRYQLTFGDKTTATHDAVVLAIPATVIRDRVTLDGNLGIALQTRAAITGLQYGDNTKTMFQFGSMEPFAALGGDGTAYATDPALPNVQVAFPSKTAAPGADPTAPVVVDYGFGERGRLLPTVDPDGSGFLGGYDAIFPGAAAAAVPLLNGELFARAHWPSEPNALGSYTCNQPGYFTTMEGWLGEPAGNLAFAGEHTDSFHNFQGFIEGAAVSGIRAAEYLLGRIRRGLL